MLQVGDIVKMWFGHSRPGTVVEIFDRHPKADEPSFKEIRTRLSSPHVRVFWSDIEAFEVVRVSELVRVECE
jgi:hypothetical protein